MSIGLKLYVLLFLVMVICLSAFTFLNIANQKKDLFDLVELNALRTTDLIKNSIHYSMLINRKEDIDQIFKNFESLVEFEVIRIYDKKGFIIFSTLPDEKGSRATLGSEACQVCHSGPEPLKALKLKQRHRIAETSDGHPVLALINPIENEESCARAECHVPPEERAILGVLDIQMSLELVNADLANNQKNTIIASGVFILVVLMAVGVLIWNQIRRPIKALISGTMAIAKGNLDHTIPIRRNDEIGELAGSFNLMVSELKRTRGELTNWSETLQEKVKKKTEELQQIQYHLLHVEKMASLGKLAATVAHELNNPLAGILTYTRLTLRRLDNNNLDAEKLKSIHDDLTIVDKETTRCGNIVKNLLLFSKHKAGEYSICDINDIIHQCLLLIQHHLELNDIKLITDYSGKSINTFCDSNHIQQALLAIMMNAIEAMDEDGILTIAAAQNETDTIIKIKDNGCGIASESVPYIFEPFYSGKKDGKGVGLGLSVAYGIIEAHKGKIDIDSTLGSGSEFIITLPNRPKAEEVNQESQVATKSEGDQIE